MDDTAAATGARFDRKIFRTAARIPWGPLWARRLCPMLLSFSVLDGTGRLALTATALLRRFCSQVFELVIPWTQVFELVKPADSSFQSVAVAGKMQSVCRNLCSLLSIQNVSAGAVLCFCGDDLPTMPWREDVLEAAEADARRKEELAAREAEAVAEMKRRKEEEEAARIQEAREVAKLEKAKLAAEREAKELAAIEADAAAEMKRRRKEEEAARFQEEREVAELEKTKLAAERKAKELAALEAEAAAEKKRWKEEEAVRVQEAERERREKEIASLRREGVLIGETIVQGTFLSVRIAINKKEAHITATDQDANRHAESTFDTSQWQGFEKILESPWRQDEIAAQTLFDKTISRLDLFYSRKRDVMVLGIKK